MATKHLNFGLKHSLEFLCIRLSPLFFAASLVCLRGTVADFFYHKHRPQEDVRARDRPGSLQASDLTYLTEFHCADRYHVLSPLQSVLCSLRCGQCRRTAIFLKDFDLRMTSRILRS
ncbi:hypothetical protein K438DRAFT_818665 [Mycena galopus ATCC 62051]|nr:hypothetical protein K438DRAFT_818665 [Mycena galopus ATCC 62051]